MDRVRKSAKKPPRRTQAERSAATQQRLLEATLKALVEEGYLRDRKSVV